MRIYIKKMFNYASQNDLSSHFLFKLPIFHMYLHESLSPLQFPKIPLINPTTNLNIL